MRDKSPDIEAWTPQDRASLSMRILKGDISRHGAAMEYGVNPTTLEAWIEEFLETARKAAALGASDNQADRLQRTPSPNGVWVCATGPDSSAPCLFLEAVCSGQFPLPANAHWTGPGLPPRRVRRQGRLPLLHGIYNEDSRLKQPLHLFANTFATSDMFERHTDLAQWGLPVPGRRDSRVAGRARPGRLAGRAPGRVRR